MNFVSGVESDVVEVVVYESIVSNRRQAQVWSVLVIAVIVWVVIVLRSAPPIWILLVVVHLTVRVVVRLLLILRIALLRM